MNSVLGINVVLLIVNIIMVCAAIRAIYIAKHSLEETQKPRRDNFLPLVIPRSIGWTSTRVSTSGDFKIENIGRGPAWNITIEYPGGEKKEIAKFLHHEKFSDVNVTLPWPDFSKVDNKFMVTMSYNDTFNRCLKVRFKVTKKMIQQEKQILTYNQQDGFEFTLPD